ncbi:MAG: histidine phosphatase family protein [Candidatus Magasanikbacteria bacterium]|nr:histidine phosphatase family protein [Candidatus Magasanikbacteria bacterium]
MKWPASVTLVRHGQSAFNAQREQKSKSALYQAFKAAFLQDPYSEETRRLAGEVNSIFALGVSDSDTPLTELGRNQARATGKGLAKTIPCPDVVYYSPYLRTRDTFAGLKEGWSDLAGVRSLSEDRIREQEHGLSLLYNDWRIFHAFHPEQHKLFELLGTYWYQFPQGESVSQVRDRIRSFTTTLIREHAGQHVLLVTHHLTILSIRANFERLSPEQFIHLDEKETPINCGVTIYHGNPEAGADGRLELASYNQRLYQI